MSPLEDTLVLAHPVRWSATLVVACVVGLALFFLKETYTHTKAKEQEHETRIQAEEASTKVTALHLSLMQKQLDRIEAKLDAAVARRRE